MRRAKSVALILWMISLFVGLSSLMFFRSIERHALDAVGQEVGNFLCPIPFSLLIAIGLLFTREPLPEPFQSRKYAPLLISILTGAGAVAVYSAFIVR